MNYEIYKSFIKGKYKIDDENMDTVEKDKLLFNMNIKLIEDLLSDSFKRLDVKFSALYDIYQDKYEEKCVKIYKDIEKDWKIVESEKNFVYKKHDKSIEIPYDEVNNEKSRKLIETIAKYNYCQKSLREKIDLVQAIFQNDVKTFHSKVNLCFHNCRSKVSEIELKNCYFQCLSNFSSDIPEIEHYTSYVIENLINEYKNDIDGFKASTLTTAYRLHERKLDKDIFKKYI